MQNVKNHANFFRRACLSFCFDDFHFNLFVFLPMSKWVPFLGFFSVGGLFPIKSGVGFSVGVHFLDPFCSRDCFRTFFGFYYFFVLIKTKETIT